MPSKGSARRLVIDSPVGFEMALTPVTARTFAKKPRRNPGRRSSEKVQCTIGP
jgi:hypothetical protein